MTSSRNADITCVKDDICSAYPSIPMKLVGFKICRIDKGKKIIELSPQPELVADVKNAAEKRKLILMPRRDIPLQQVIVVR